MFGRNLRSTTALVIALGLTAPHPAMAQNIVNGNDGNTTELKEKLDKKMKDVKDKLGKGNGANANAGAQANANIQAQGKAKAKGKDKDKAARGQGGANLQAQGNAAAETGATAQGQGQQQVNKLQKQLEEGLTGQASGEADSASSLTTGQGTQGAAADADAQAGANAQSTNQQSADTGTAAQGQGQAQEQVNKLQKQLEEGLTGQASGEADAASSLTTGQGTQGTAEADTQTTIQQSAEGEQGAQSGTTLQQSADQKAEDLREALQGQTSDLPEVDEEQKQAARQKAKKDDIPELSSQEQAQKAARALQDQLDAAALSGQGEIVDETRTRITDETARSSSEAFDTDLSGRQRAAAAAAAQDDDDDDLLKALGVAAVAGLGAYAVGQFLNDGSQVVANTGDRIVVEQDGYYRVIKDDNALLRRPGNEVKTDTFSDGSTRTVVTAPDGTQTITIRAADGRVLQRIKRYPDGQEVVLIDDTRRYSEVDVNELSRSRANVYEYSDAGQDDLSAALASTRNRAPNRAYSLYQVRNIDVVRNQVPVITLDAINFETNSAAIQPREAEELAALGEAMREAIDRDPRQIFLVEGHTDTVGSAAYNLALSDRRAESVALALTEYFDVPPANMVVQGYGESDLKVEQRGDIRANRRAAVRNITPLLNGGT